MTLRTIYNDRLVDGEIIDALPAAPTISEAGKVLKVNTGGTAIEYATGGGGAGVRTYTLSVGFADADYICDGTADNVQIQQAIDDVGALGGGTVFIQSGTYDIAAVVDLKTYHDIQIIGDQLTKFVLANGANCHVIQNNTGGGAAVPNITVENLIIDGNKSGNTGSIFGIQLINVSNLKIRNCKIHDCKLDGIYTHSITGGEISGNVCYSNGRNGIANGVNTVRMTTDVIYFGNTCYSNTNAGIDLEPVTYCKCDKNDCYSNYIGITLYDASTIRLGNICTNNTCHGNTTFGIFYKYQQHGQITGNITYSNTESGIEYNECQDCTISGNNSYDNDISGITGAYSTKCSVTDNTCAANTQHGIYIEGDYHNITGNIAKNNSIGSTTYSGIRLVNVNRSTVSDNVCYDDQAGHTQKYGIYENGSSDYNTYIGNTTYGNVTSGISTVGANNVFAKQDLMATNKLLGRGTAGSGVIEEITLGTNLSLSGTTLNAAGGVPTTITVANEASDTTCFPSFFTAATGDLGPKTNSGLTFNATTGNLGSTLFNGLTLASQAVGFTIAGGTSSKTLTVDETVSMSAKTDKLTPTATKTSNYTASANEFVPCNVSGGSFAVTLPSAPADGTRVRVQLLTVGTNKQLEVKTGGTDKFFATAGPTSLYMYIYGETQEFQYQSASGFWNGVSSSPAENFANQFPGVDAITPITNADITVDATARTLTITPPLGFFNIFVDGGGKTVKYRKTTVVFGDGSGTSGSNTWTDTSGSWYFYFNSAGQPVTTQNTWTVDDFPNVVPIYRALWNASLSGTNKLVAQYVEYHVNDIPADVHAWYHLYGCIWQSGFTMVNNALVSGSPNADGRNTVIALTTGKNTDDNLEYTVTNSTAGTAWTQDLGNTTAASLNATNSSQFKIFVQDAGSLVSFLPATRFPFPWDSGTNVPQYITSTGTRTAVTNQRFMVTFVYSTQNHVAGEPLKVVCATQDFTTLTNARAYTWTDIQNTYSIFGSDTEIRPLYRLIFEVHTSTPATYDVGAKYSVLRETQDIRKAAVTSTTAASGSLPASSVTVVPAGNIASTNTQAALEELDSEKVPTSRTLTINGTAYDLSADRSWTISSGISWSEVTGTSQSMAVDTGYIANNGSLVTLTLPSTAAIGKVVRVTGKGNGGWRISQNASQIINFNSTSTTAGTGGYIASTYLRDAVELVCVVADTQFNVISSTGNITVV